MWHIKRVFVALAEKLEVVIEVVSFLTPFECGVDFIMHATLWRR